MHGAYDVIKPGFLLRQARTATCRNLLAALVHAATRLKCARGRALGAYAYDRCGRIAFAGVTVASVPRWGGCDFSTESMVRTMQSSTGRLRSAGRAGRFQRTSLILAWTSATLSISDSRPVFSR